MHMNKLHLVKKIFFMKEIFFSFTKNLFFSSRKTLWIYLMSYYFCNKSFIIDIQLGYIQTSKNIEILKVMLRWSKSLWLLQHVAFLVFYCSTTFCNINFFKYLMLGIFYLWLYSSFLLIKPSATQYKFSISFRWGNCTLSFFSCSRPVNM